MREERNLPITTTRSSPYSIDENLWGRSIECGVLEDPWTAPPEDIYELTSFARRTPRQAAATSRCPSRTASRLRSTASTRPAEPDRDARQGRRRLRIRAHRHGRGPAGRASSRARSTRLRPRSALIAAHRDLETLTLERQFAREKRRMDALWADLVYEGLWFSPLREAAEAFAATTRVPRSGDVRLRFTSGGCLPVARRSNDSLYDHGLATYDAGDAFNHADAAGFVRLWGLPGQAVGEGARRSRGSMMTEDNEMLWGGRFARRPPRRA